MSESAKEKFEKERDKILSELPAEIKAQFGQIMFAPVDDDDDDDSDDSDDNDEDEDNEEHNNKANNNNNKTVSYRPVLLLSPYDIPPRPYRDVYWFDMFTASKKKTKQQGGGRSLQHVVYHYGNNTADDCYSFVEVEDLIPYEIAAQQGWTELPPELQHKLNTSSTPAGSVSLTEQEEEWVRAIQEMKEDLAKAPEERKRGVLNFQERHEVSAAATGAAAGAATTKKKSAPPAKRQKTKK